MLHDNTKGIILAAISAASFGALAIFTKFGYALGATASTILIIRFFSAFLFLWALCLIQGRVVLLPAKQVVVLLLMGALGYGMASYFLFLSLALIPASIAGLLLYTYPTLVTIFAHLLGDETIDSVKTGALILASIGLVLVLGVSFQTINNLGIVLALGAALTYSIFIIESNRVLQSLNPILATVYVCLGGFILHLTLGLFTGQISLYIPVQAWLYILAIAFISTILAFLTFYRSIQLIGPSKASIVSILEPVVTAILAAVFLSERLSSFQIGGGLIILLAIVLLQWQTPSKSKQQKESKMQTNESFTAHD